ncbi:acyl-CoA N-acyltransferase [Nemania sp. NC0429]|nr:acyl-CoA N-acyltransferase [Nemania sp. NC0429]
MSSTDIINNKSSDPTLPAQQPAMSNTDITVGHALPSEAAAIAKIGADTFTTTFGFAVTPEDLKKFLAETYVESAVLADLADPTTETFAARDAAGKVWGMVQLVRDVTDPVVSAAGDPAPHAHLQRLYVVTDAHGRGIGTKLMAAVEAQARAEGFKTIWLSVWENSAGAQRLYGKLGYRKIGTTEFPMGDCVHTDFLLSKIL